MDSKALILVAMAIAAALLAWGPREASAGTIGIRYGTVQFLNAVGERVTVPLCAGPDGDNRGPFVVENPGFQYFQFPVNILSHGWRCSFEWVDSKAGGRKYTASVLVWKGILRGAERAAADAPDGDSRISVVPKIVPCVDCIWKIQRDGFYRGDDHQGFQLMARWNSLIVRLELRSLSKLQLRSLAISIMVS